MALMENVKRIKEAKAALKTAIKDKGVKVPDDALLSEYPALVEKIETAADELAPIYEIVFDVKTGGLTDFAYLFSGYKGEDLTGVRKLDTSKVKSFYSTFVYCSEITELDLSAWDVSSATTFESMFQGTSKLTKLDVSTWKIPETVSSMYYMFHSCGLNNTDSLKNWDVSKVKNMGSMFNSCPNLQTADLLTWDVSSATNMSGMFNSCKKLESLDLSTWDVGNVINFGTFCSFCSALEEFKAPKNIKTSIRFDYSGLNYESLMSVINNLAPVETTQTLTLGSALLKKLSAEDIAIATQKGWTVK